MIAKILPTFTNEPALVGELIELDVTTCDIERTGRLLGDSEYIRENTDGYVRVMPDDIQELG